MRSTPSRLLIGTVVAGALFLGACSSSSSDSSSTDSTPTKARTITVCSDMPYKPFEFQEDGKTTGFDYDVVAAMMATFDAQPEFKTTPFDTIIPALVAGDCEMIASAMTITDERAERVNFTDPYFDADQSLLIRADGAETYKTLADLAGKTIGVQAGTSGADYAEANKPAGATIKEFQTGDEMFPALITPGDIDAALQDYPVNAYRATQDDQFVVTETFPTGEQYGFAITKENTELLGQMNTALAEIKANGTYDEIFAKWFGSQS
jgi:polar amino acid transport system substrate-binding protein